MRPVALSMAGWWHHLTMQADSLMAFNDSLPDKHPHAVSKWAFECV